MQNRRTYLRSIIPAAAFCFSNASRRTQLAQNKRSFVRGFVRVAINNTHIIYSAERGSDSAAFCLGTFRADLLE
jgi:hypothetical protein